MLDIISLHPGKLGLVAGGEVLDQRIIRGSGYPVLAIVIKPAADVASSSDLPRCSMMRHGACMTDDFYRIQRLPPYVFAEVNAMKAAARLRGEDVVDLGMGNPDGAPPKHVIDKLAEVAAKSTAHRYSASRGIPGLRKAQAAYYQ